MARSKLINLCFGMIGCLSLNASANAQVTFNGGAIAIPAFGPASPYPSTINISGYTGTITEIRVTITGFSHTFTDDVGALFVGPTGARTILFNGPGTDLGFSAVNLNLNFFDGAAAPLPDNAAFASGNFQPGQQQYTEQFSAPAPQWTEPGPPNGHPTTFAGFVGTNPNGDYTLFVEDFVGGDQGSISSWSITVFGITPVPEPTSILLGTAGFGLAGAAVRRRWRAKRA